MKNLNNLEEDIYKIRNIQNIHSEDIKLLLISYVDKKAFGKKNVMVLPTMHQTLRVTTDQRKKPDMIVL